MNKTTTSNVNTKPANLAKRQERINNNSANETLRNEIDELVQTWNLYLDDKQKSHRINVNTKLPLENLTDALASLIFPNVFDKQKLLEESNVQRRAQFIINDLKSRLEMISITSQKRKEIVNKRNLN